MILYLSLQLIVRACDGLSWDTPAGLWSFESRARGYVADWNLLMSGCRKLDRGSEVKHTTVWVTVTVSFHFEKRTRWGYVWLVGSSGSLAITTSCDRLRRCSSYSCTRKLATILCLAAAATSPLYLFHTHKALLVLIPMVMGLLSPRGSQILQQQLQVQVSDVLTWERCSSIGVLLL